MRDAAGVTLKETGYGKSPALTWAQRAVEFKTHPLPLTVELVPLFGTPVVVYRVEKQEKDVLTWTLANVD